MPRRQTETSKIAKALGVTYAFVKHRHENGIPLDAPRMTNNNRKAWHTRRKQKALRYAMNPLAVMVVARD